LDYDAQEVVSVIEEEINGAVLKVPKSSIPSPFGKKSSNGKKITKDESKS
jgi:hypothetical protein